jgi:hypothetical protein
MISHYYIGSLWLILSYCFEARGDWIAPHQGTQLKKKRLNLDFCVEAMGEEAAQLIINAFVAPGQKLCLSRVSRARGMDQKLWQLWYHIDPYNLRDEHSFIYPDLSAWRWHMLTRGLHGFSHVFTHSQRVSDDEFSRAACLLGTSFWSDFARDLHSLQRFFCLNVWIRLAFCIVTYCNTPWGTLSLGGFCQFEGQKLRLDPFGFLQV